MSFRAYVFLIIIALFIFLYILKSVLKKEISEVDAIIWLSLSFFGLIFVSIPSSIDLLISITGVKYAPTAFLGLIILFLIIQNIKLITKLYLFQKKQIKITQEMALMEYKINKLMELNQKDE